MKLEFVLFISLLATCSAFADVAKLSVVVVDEETNAPIPNVTVRGGFEMDAGWRAWTDSCRPNEEIRLTDGEGRCNVQGKTNCGRAGIAVRTVPFGYYKPGLGKAFQFKEKNGWGVWLPDNLVVTIRLQRVGRPIPLKVKRVGNHVSRSRVGYVDGTNSVFKYDLIRGDYLPPDGKGEVADMEVASRLCMLSVTNISRQTKRFFDFATTVSFPGEGNGVVAVATRPTDGVRLRTAPETGYVRQTTVRCGLRKKLVPPNVYGESYSESDPDRGYYFRIRSQFDDKGRLIGAYYGKVYGDFLVGCRLKEGCSVEFLYYVNPNSLDRNLEWDCQSNIFPEIGRCTDSQP